MEKDTRSILQDSLRHQKSPVPPATRTSLLIVILYYYFVCCLLVISSACKVWLFTAYRSTDLDVHRQSQHSWRARMNTSMTFPRPELSPMPDSTDLRTVLFWIANRAVWSSVDDEYISSTI